MDMGIAIVEVPKGDINLESTFGLQRMASSLVVVLVLVKGILMFR